MAYNTTAIKTDVNGKPIPQYFDPLADEYKPLLGQHGAARSILYGPDGQPIGTVGNQLQVKAHDTDAALGQIKDALGPLATETKLEAVRTLLASLVGKDFATQTTLAQIKQVLDTLNGVVSTSSKQDALNIAVEDLKSELTLVKSELANIKANQLSGDQKVQLSGTFTEDILSKMDLSNSLLALISHGQTKAVLNSWQQVQHIVRAGLHHQVFQIGDQFVTEFNGAPSVWVVIGIDHDKPTDPRFTHSLTIQSHDCLLTAQFDAPEPDNPDSGRQQFGNNRYLHSAIRQWLNSAETTFTWQPQHQYDAAPTGAPYNGPGFLKLLDPELVAVLGAVDKQVARNTVIDGGGQDLFSDKVFLLSRVEVYGGAEGETGGEAPYPYYESMAPSPTTDALDGRIKYLGASARNWWLRSPGTGFARSVRSVHTSGSITTNSATDLTGVAPAVVIV